MKVGDHVYYQRGIERYHCRIATTFDRDRGRLRGMCHLEADTGRSFLYVPLAKLEPAPVPGTARRTKACGR